MDKITQRTLKRLDQLAEDLEKCQRHLEQIGNAKVKIYLGVPPAAREGFHRIYNALEQMRRQLNGEPPRPEG